MTVPVLYRWDGEHMVPVPGLAKLCDKQFVVGETYRLEVVQHRSGESHRHYFAALHEAYGNLPDHIRERFPTVDHLRKYALIKGGYRNETTYIAHSKAEALRFSSFLRSLDEYALVHVDGHMVALFTAKSQSLSEMTKKEFGESKNAVLDIVAGMIGVPVDELTRNAGRAA